MKVIKLDNGRGRLSGPRNDREVWELIAWELSKVLAGAVVGWVLCGMLAG